jgi:tRNA nucleotidyltransferase (CCA-adding enzyme)
MKGLLEKIILSDFVVEEFYENFNNNKIFRKWIDNYLPEIGACEAQQQDNPWHIYNVLKHILVSVEKMNSQTHGQSEQVRKRLAYTMLLHDIGKPECHMRRVKDGQMIDSFFHHNDASEKVARRFLNDLGFSKEELEIIAKLVNKHDVFMFIRDGPTQNKFLRPLSNELINDEIKDLNSVGDGKELLTQLVMVRRSDSLAQNPEKTGKSLQLLNKFENMLKNLVGESEMV